MTSKDQSLFGDNFGAAMWKIIVLILPNLLAPLFGLDFRRHHLIGGLALIAGALLQALIPPRTKGLLPLLAFAVAWAVFYTFFWK